MPESSGSMVVGAGVGLPSRASVGGSIPALPRASSVRRAIVTTGAAAPRQAPGAGVIVVGARVPVPRVLVGVGGAFDSNELDKMQQRQFTGGRPSGFGEAFNELRKLYTEDGRDLGEDLEAIARGAARQGDEIVQRFNAIANSLGLPTVATPSEAMNIIIGREEQSAGFPGQASALTVVTEVLPAWRSDP